MEGLGYPMPKLRLPLWLVFYAAFLIELLHAAVWRVYNFQPLLTRAEVYKTGEEPAKCAQHGDLTAWWLCLLISGLHVG